MADLILVARDGYAVSGDATGDAFVVPTEATSRAHGYLATEPKMNALFVASGAGIEVGAKLAAVARLLGLPPLPASGRVLEEILSGWD